MTLDITVCRDALKKTFSDHGRIELLKAIINGAEPENPENPGSTSSLPWCSCGRCRAMSLEIENVCCRKRPCVTAQDFFQSAVLNMNILSISIVNQSDVFADDPDYSPSRYWKTAYRQWILWQHGYLGRTNRRVVPSCIVWDVHDKYPAPDGQYLGFKEY